MTTLSRRGYLIPKAELTAAQVQQIRDELTVKPIVNKDYVFAPVQAYPLFRENDLHISVPRYYGQSRFGTASNVVFAESRERPRLKPNISLRDQQVDVVNATMTQLRTTGGGVLALATGFGKTAICLYIIGQLRVKTLIVVHKSFLMQQWRERIAQFLPHATVGTIQGSTVDTDKDIVIGMLQSLSMKSYPKETFADFGLIAVDEVHHVGAEVFCRALPKVVVPYTLGLSATVERKDGLTKVIHWFLGDIAYRLDKNQVADTVQVKRIMYHSSDPTYSKEKRNFRGVIMLPTMINNVAAHVPRNNAIVNEVVALVHEEPRQIMVLSDRLAHLDVLKQAIDGKQVCVRRDGVTRPLITGYYTGRQKPAELKVSEKADVIFATRAMSAEGLDIPSLNTLLFATPAGDVVQACGRILRKRHAIAAMIVDVVDTFSVFLGQARKRYAFYKKSGYGITSEFCNDAGDRCSPTEPEQEPEQEPAQLCDACLIESDDD